MYRSARMESTNRLSFPHRRGDVPVIEASRKGVDKFSPQAWGCTESRPLKVLSIGVFPTGVGMYRKPVR